MSRYIEQALDPLHSQIETRIAAKLDDVESDESLTAGSLENPLDVLKFEAPQDLRSPLIQVFDIGARPYGADGQRHGLYEVACRVRAQVANDGDAEAGEEKARRYSDAVKRSILHDATLGGAVLQVVITGEAPSAQLNDTTSTFNFYDIDCDVLVQSITGG